MAELRRILFAGVGGGLLLLTGCATPMFGGDPCGCPRQGLFSRLGLRRHSPCCAEPAVIGTTVSSVPVIGGPSVDCPCQAPLPGGVVPGGGFTGPPITGGPILPPADPGVPYPSTIPGPPPAGVFPGTPAPGTLPPPVAVPGEARPVPAGPSSRRA